MKIQNALVSNVRDRSQRYFAHVTTVTLSWRVQNIVVIGHVYFTLECFEFSSNFEFDRNMLSGTGAWHRYIDSYDYRSGATEVTLKDMYHKSMAWCKTAVTPVRKQWSYCSLALKHRCICTKPQKVTTRLGTALVYWNMSLSCTAVY